ncbi:MAG: hypothetical protein Q8Q62_15330 [Mesorhizobium sp.]|nr:hypothetical protein [Mesorhizobium sp.]
MKKPVSSIVLGSMVDNAFDGIQVSRRVSLSGKTTCRDDAPAPEPYRIATGNKKAAPWGAALIVVRQAA